MKNKKLRKRILFVLLCGAFLAFVLGIDYSYFADEDGGSATSIEMIDDNLGEGGEAASGEETAEVPTEASTEAVTEALTEVTTESPTEASSELSTETSGTTEEITELTTEEITEETTEVPVEEMTDLPEEIQELDEVSEDTIENGESDNVIINSALYNISSNYTLDEVDQLDSDNVRYQMIHYAIQFLGNPYVWGGTSLTNGTDCSGFTLSVYGKFGYALPRTAAAQHSYVKSLTKDELKPGDLVFFNDGNGHVSHVAMYMGNDQIIHASSSKVGIIVSNINYREACGYGTLIEDVDDSKSLDLSDYSTECNSTVNNIIYEFAKKNSDLSIFSTKEITDNESLIRALYYSYGSAGYNKYREQLEELYLSWGCESAEDKLEENNAILYSLYKESETAHASEFMDVVLQFDYPSSSFEGVYIYDNNNELVGASFVTKTSYDVSTLNQEDEAFLNAVGDAVENGKLEIQGTEVVEVEEGALAEAENNADQFEGPLNPDYEATLKVEGGFTVESSGHESGMGTYCSFYQILRNGVYCGTGYCFDHRANTTDVGSSLTKYEDDEISARYGISLSDLSAMDSVYFNSPLFPDSTRHFTDSKTVAGLALSYIHKGEIGLSQSSTANAQAREVAAQGRETAWQYPLGSKVPQTPTISDNGQTVKSTVEKSNQTFYISKPMKLTNMGTNSVNGDDIIFNGKVPAEVNGNATNVAVVVSPDNNLTNIKKAFNQGANYTTGNKTYQYAYGTQIIKVQNGRYLTFFWGVTANNGAENLNKAISMDFANETPLYKAMAFQPADSSLQPVFMGDSVTRSFNVTVTGGPYDIPAYCYLKKQSANTPCTNNNTMYSLAGANYTLRVNKNRSQKAQVYVAKEGSKLIKETVGALLTNAQGEFYMVIKYNGDISNVKNLYGNNVTKRSDGRYQINFTSKNPIMIPAGDYALFENKAPKGYKKDQQCDINRLANPKTGHILNVTKNHTKTNPAKAVCKEEPMLDPLKLSMVKQDLDTGNTVALGGGKLGGAVFEVDYYDGLYTEKNLPKTKTRKWFFATDENGKWDFANSPVATGSNYVSSAFYENQNGERSIPIGTVVVKEIKAPEGYYTTTGNEVTEGAISYYGTDGTEHENASSKAIVFQIRQDPDVEGIANLYLGDSNEISNGKIQVKVEMKDPVKRGDFAFTKEKYEDKTKMPHIAFILKSLDTGEQHIVVTDDNGYFSTKDTLTIDGNEVDMSEFKNTNKNDKYLDDLANPAVYNNELRPTPVWFYGTNKVQDQDESTINNPAGQGALPYGKYSLVEIKSKGNANTQLIGDGECTFEVTPDDDGTPYFVLEALSDMPTPKIETLSRDAEQMGHNSYPKPGITVIDKVSYQYLQYDTEYTIKGIMIAREDCTSSTGETYVKYQPIKDDHGNYIMAHTNFKTVQRGDNAYNTNASGSVNLTYTFDAETLEGVKGVWATYLCESDDSDLVLDGDNVDAAASKVIKFNVGLNNQDVFVFDANVNNTDEWINFTQYISTKAFTNQYETNVSQAGKTTVIRDDVFINGLIEGQKYTLVSSLVDPETNKVVDAKDGKPCTKETEFTYKEENGKMKLTVTLPAIDATPYAGKKLVVFESIKENDSVIATEDSITNTDQTIYFPKLETEATGEEGEKIIPLTGTVTIVDNVKYSNVAVGKEYTVVGTLYYKDENGEEKPLRKKDGSLIQSSKVITPTAENGSVDIPFTFDVNDCEGPFPNKVVVFENMYYNDMELCCHEDIEDEDQTVEFPSVVTSLKDASTGVQFIEDFSGNLTLEDTVSYSGLEKGKSYTVVGKLINKKTGKVLTGKSDGKEIVGYTTFKADAKEGTTTVKFTFDADDIDMGEDNAIAQIVCFEYLYDEFDAANTTPERTDEGFVDYYNGVTLWAVHNDINDTKQTVSTVSGHTEMTDTNTGAHESASVDEYVYLTDRIFYKGLIVGEAYTVTGTLYTTPEQATPEELKLKTVDENGVECCPVLDDGKLIQTTKIFVAQKTTGTIEVEFKFHKSVLEKNKEYMVAFEEVTDSDERTVFTHQDITDQDQTVTFPEVHTTALSEDTSDHMMGDYKVAKIIDTVAYENLIKGNTYKIVGKLMDKETAAPVVIDGKEITVEGKPFKCESPDGTYDMVFELDARYMAGHTVVAYETLYVKDGDGEWKICGKHEDIEDEGQSVHVTDLHTSAHDKESGTHNVTPGKQTTIVDTVTYTNLIPGRTYTISGMLMLVPEDGNHVSVLDRLTGNTAREGDQTYSLNDALCTYDETNNIYVDQNGYECSALLVDGKPVTASATFTAEQANGTIDLEFTFDSSALAGRQTVVFENLYADDILVGVHADITDEDQTTDYPPDNPPPVKTSDNYPLTRMIIIAIVLVVGIGSTIMIKVRRKKKQSI